MVEKIQICRTLILTSGLFISVKSKASNLISDCLFLNSDNFLQSSSLKVFIHTQSSCVRTFY